MGYAKEWGWGDCRCVTASFPGTELDQGCYVGYCGSVCLVVLYRCDV